MKNKKFDDLELFEESLRETDQKLSVEKRKVA